MHNDMCKSLENATNWQSLLNPGEKLRYFYNKCKLDVTKMTIFKKNLIFFNTVTPCKLLCYTEEKNMYIDTLIKLPDGTKCSPFTNDVCINGACRVDL